MDFSQTKGAYDNPSSVVYSRKFDTAIRDSFLVKAIANVTEGNLTEDEWMLIESDKIEGDFWTFSTSPHHYGSFLKTLLVNTNVFQSDTLSIKTINDSIRINITNYRHQLGFCTSQLLLPSRRRVLNEAYHNNKYDKLPIIIYNLLIASQRLSHLIEQSNKMHGITLAKYKDKEERKKQLLSSNSFYITETSTLFVWSHTLLCLKQESEWFILPKSVILMYHNKVCDLISVLTLAYYSEGVLYSDNWFSTFLTWIRELIHLLYRYKNRFFSIMKVLEGIVTAETLIVEEQWKNNEFLRCIVNDLYEETNYDYVGSNLQTILLSCNSAEKHELGCTSKLMGHPLVSMIKGSKKLHSKTTSDEYVDPKLILQCVNHCKRDYIKKHIAKFHKWPPSQLNSPNTPKALQMSYILGKDPDSLYIKQKFGGVLIDWYIFIDLLPNLQFHKLETIIPHLKDKTISVLRNKVVNKYLNHGNEYVGWEETRLLLAYLLNPTMVHDHVKYLDDYTNCTDFNQLLNYLTIRIVPKEKELKIEYRGFGCKTYEDRHRSLAQEKNVMMYLDQFSDEQAMTTTELQLIKKLDAFRRIKNAYKNHTVLYIVIDSSAWNNKFREATVDNIMSETLDKIYDYPIFSKTHKAYQNTLYYIPDYKTTYYWYGQGGGIEGLNQDTWVVVYLSQIKVALQKYQLKYHILCKGDDLRIVLLVPEDPGNINDIHGLKNEVVTNISSTARKFGHKINIEESYGSSLYLAFSKGASLGVIELPQTTRKIQKCYGANNAFINTLDDYIASSFSNAHSACKTSPIITPCYLVGTMWASFYLKNSGIYRHLSDNQIIALLQAPSLVGGFPIIFLHNMHVRAESDLLSPFIALIKYYQICNPELSTILSGFLTIPLVPPDSLIGIFKDPYSIPSSRPTLPGTKLRSYIVPILEKLSKNHDIKELIRASKSDQMSIVIETLESCNVIRAKVLSLIWSSTPQGLLDELLRKFESGRSIMELLLLKYKKGQTNRILKNVMIAEKRLNLWRADRVKGKHLVTEISLDYLIQDCPAKSAYDMRKVAWGKPVEDITMPPMQHQLMIGYAASNPLDTWGNLNHFNFFISEVETNIRYNKHEQYMAGPNDPFLGYTTSTGSITPSVHFIEKDVSLSKVRTLLDLITWINISSIDEQGNELISNSVSLIEKLIGMYTDIKLSDLMPFQSIRKSGTSQHHMRSPNFRESIIPNVLSNVYTRVSGESNSHINLRTSSQHFRMNFLHCYCWSVWMATIELELLRNITTPRVIWSVTNPCKFCNTPIKEVPLTFNQKLINACDFPLLKVTQLGTVSEHILIQSLEQQALKDLNIKTLAGTELTLRSASIGLLQELIDVTYHDKAAIQDRFTQHTLDQKGLHIMSVLSTSDHRRLVGLTEIKSLPIADMFDYLMVAIVNLLPSMCRPVTMNNVEYWLMRTAASDIPWYLMVNYIFDAGRLHNLINLAHIHCNISPGMALNDVRSATKYLGTCAVTLYIEEIYIPLVEVTVLSFYTTEMLAKHVKKIVYYQRDSLLTKHYPKAYFSSVTSTTDDSIIYDMIVLYMQGLAVFVSFPDNDEEIQLMIDQIKTQHSTIIECVDFSRCEYDRLDEILDEFESKTLTHRGCILLCTWITKLLRMSNRTRDDLYDMYISRVQPSLVSLNIQQNVHLTYTTISECISVIRASRGQNTSQQDEDDVDNITHIVEHSDLFLHLQLDANHFSKPSLLVNMRMTEEVDDITSHYTLPLVETYKYSNFFSPISFHRVIGNANSSANTLLDILTSLQIPLVNLLPKYSFVLCMADGIGGFTLVLDYLIKDCHIVWHTKPDDNNLECYPTQALLRTFDRNTIHYKHVHEGYVDLTSSSTYSRFLQYSKIYHLITSDLEYKPGDPIGYRGIYENQLDFCLRYLITGGLLIVSLDIEYLNVLLHVFTSVQPYITSGIIFKPKSEVYPTGYYFIAVRNAHPYNPSWLNSTAISDDLFRRARTFIIHHNRLVERRCTFDNGAFDICKGNTQHLRPYCIPLGSYGLTQFEDIFHTSIDRENLNLMYIKFMKPLTDNDLQNMRLSVTTKIKRMQDDLNNPVTQSRIVITGISDYNTRTARIKYLKLLFNMFGIDDAQRLFKGFTSSYILSNSRMWNKFLDHYHSLNVRDKTVISQPTRYGTTANEYTNDEYLWRSYNEGVMIWISILGYIRANLDKRTIEMQSKQDSIHE